jgi:hypothetical protein
MESSEIFNFCCDNSAYFPDREFSGKVQRISLLNHWKKEFVASPVQYNLIDFCIIPYAKIGFFNKI